MSPSQRSSHVYVSFIRTTPEKLWHALTDPRFMHQYWFGATAECSWKQGAPWRLVRPDGRTTDSSGELVEIDPPRRMVIRWTNEWMPELKAEGPSLCTITLEPAGSAVKLTITHEIDRPGSKLISAVAGGWPKVVSNLKSLLESGAVALADTAAAPKTGYAPVNGLQMYYEIEGRGEPLVYIPAAFGHAGAMSLPELAENRSVIKVDLQGHGRTADLPDRPFSLEQHAKDVVGLLDQLGVSRADFFGHSFGGGIATLIALHHPERVRRVATYSATFGPAEGAHDTATLRYDEPPTPNARAFRHKRQSYEQVAPDPGAWPRIWEKVAAVVWRGFTAEQLASIKCPVLIAVGDHDFVLVEHALDTFRRLPNAQLAVIPDASHFAPLSEPGKIVPVVKRFLEEPDTRLPLVVAAVGHQPGETR